MPLDCETVVGGQLVVLRSQVKKKNARTVKHRTKLGFVRFALVRLKPPALGAMKAIEKLKKTPNPKSQTKGPGPAHICAFENKAACVWCVETIFLTTKKTTICSPQE